MKFNSMLVSIPAALLALSIAGCDDGSLDKEKKERVVAEQLSAQTGSKIQILSQKLSGKELSNAKLIGLYADVVEKDDPSVKEIVEHFREESTPSGDLYTSLVRRYQSVNNAFITAKNKVDSSEKENQDYKQGYLTYSNTVEPELKSINGAASEDDFNDALSDIVNTLAEMSKDKLARVDGKKPAEFYAQTNAQNNGPGTLLVGNETYGHWRQNEQGDSFWEFYGKYAMLSSLLGQNNSGHVYYNNWSERRPYSAYNDNYGYRYGSQTYKSNTATLNKRYHVTPSLAARTYIEKTPVVKQKFQKFNSAYSVNKTKTNASLSSGTVSRTYTPNNNLVKSSTPVSQAETKSAEKTNFWSRSLGNQNSGMSTVNTQRYEKKITTLGDNSATKYKSQYQARPKSYSSYRSSSSSSRRR